MTFNIRLIFILCLSLLIFTKLVELYHFYPALPNGLYLSSFFTQSSKQLTIDIDRLLALLLFLAAYIWHFKTEAKLKLAVLLNTIFGITCLIGYAYSPAVALTLLTAYFLTSMVEEIIRATVIQSLLTKFSRLSSVLISSTLFVLVHPSIYSNLTYAIAVFVLGISLGSIYIYFHQKQQRALGVTIVSLIHCGVILLGIELKLIT